MTNTYSFKQSRLLFLVCSFLLFSCGKDDPIPNDQPTKKLETISVKDLNGLEHGHVCYSLEQQKIVEESSEDWDIKLAGTAISFGKGATGQLVEGLIDSYTKAPDAGYSEKPITGNNSYYTYTNANEPKHAVLMKPGVLILIKTSKGNYAKIEMISYYKGNPNVNTASFADLNSRPAKQHFTFNYVLQPNGSQQF